MALCDRRDQPVKWLLRVKIGGTVEAREPWSCPPASRARRAGLPTRNGAVQRLATDRAVELVAEWERDARKRVVDPDGPLADEDAAAWIADALARRT